MFVLALPFVIDGCSRGMTRDPMHWTSSRWSLGISQRQTAENCNRCCHTFDFHFCACHDRVCCRLPCRILNSWGSRANGTVCSIQQCEYSDEKSNPRKRVKPIISRLDLAPQVSPRSSAQTRETHGLGHNYRSISGNGGCRVSCISDVFAERKN